MNEMNEILIKLGNVAIDAVEFVGSANYEERERHACDEIRRCFKAAKAKKVDEIVFNHSIPED